MRQERKIATITFAWQSSCWSSLERDLNCLFCLMTRTICWTRVLRMCPVSSLPSCRRTGASGRDLRALLGRRWSEGEREGLTYLICRSVWKLIMTARVSVTPCSLPLLSPRLATVPELSRETNSGRPMLTCSS